MPTMLIICRSGWVKSMASSLRSESRKVLPLNAAFTNKYVRCVLNGLNVGWE